MKGYAGFGMACLMTLAPFGARAAGGPALESLVAAERAFSALSVVQGIKPSFLANLAHDAIVFRPTATNGRRAIADRPAPKATLIWEPAYAEVSASGDLGYTTGPWELRPQGANGAPSAFGHFISVWKKQPNGAWRVAVDIGTSHARPERGVGSGDFVPGPAPGARAAKGAGPADLPGLDGALGRAMRSGGIGPAYATMGAPDVRFNRDGMMPLVGIDPVRAVLDTMPGFIDYRPEGRRIAASGDLGCTWGQALHEAPGGSAPADTNVYLHVWRKNADHQWKLALEVLNPLQR